ncbi:MAG: acyltransferase [Chitinophagales bacterium]|nr:acyltransferase [Chitinophagales bacterium]
MIKPLTSLRFFFALMVFFSHLWFLKDETPFLQHLYDDIFYEGYIGVSFFFILSGFVLGYSYHDKILCGETRFAQFWLARFARIYPLHLLTLLIAIPLSFKGALTEWITRFVLNLFLIQSFVPSDDIYFYFNSVSWSISDEWFFYIMFPFIVFLLYKRKYIKVAPVILLLIPIMLYLAKEAYHEKYFYINPLLRIGDFVIGVILYRLYRKRKDIEILRNRNAATIAEITSILALCVFFYFHNDIPQGYRYSCYYWPPMVMLIYTFSYSRGYLSDILSNKVLVYLGEISFGFYMIHMLIIRYYSYIPTKFPSFSVLMPKGYIEAYVV